MLEVWEEQSTNPSFQAMSSPQISKADLLLMAIYNGKLYYSSLFTRVLQRLLQFHPRLRNILLDFLLLFE
jgi:hypothetical protein